jgi:hypothetical protein
MTYFIEEKRAGDHSTDTESAYHEGRERVRMFFEEFNSSKDGRILISRIGQSATC